MIDGVVVLGELEGRRVVDEAVDGFLVMVVEERVVADPGGQTLNKQVRLMLIV